MGSILPSFIQIIADSVGITGLSDEAAKVLAPDAEYHVREVVQVLLPPPLLGRVIKYSPHLLLSPAEAAHSACRG